MNGSATIEHDSIDSSPNHFGKNPDRGGRPARESNDRKRSGDRDGLERDNDEGDGIVDWFDSSIISMRPVEIIM